MYKSAFYIAVIAFMAALYFAVSGYSENVKYKLQNERIEKANEALEADIVNLQQARKVLHEEGVKWQLKADSLRRVADKSDGRIVKLKKVLYDITHTHYRDIDDDELTQRLSAIYFEADSL